MNFDTVDVQLFLSQHFSKCKYSTKTRNRESQAEINPASLPYHPVDCNLPVKELSLVSSLFKNCFIDQELVRALLGSLL